MNGSIAALYRYPIKGFTPEPVRSVALRAGEAFPHDRLFAVENGPSGFDPDAPRHIPKRKFAVLARSATVAAVRTRYDEATGRLSAEAPGAHAFDAPVGDQAGRDAFAAWLTPVLAVDKGGPYRMIDGRGHRFLDDPDGHVSVLNLASVRDLEQRLGVAVDPLRFRANIHVEGWEPWSENTMSGNSLHFGSVAARALRPITRCAAPDVDPTTAARDMNITSDLHRLYGHLWCGLYVQVISDGSASVGDEVRV